MTENNPQTTVMTELARLREMIDEIGASLRSQRDMLRKRGINLPPMTLQAVNGISNDLASTEKRVVNEQTEIGQLRTIADNAAMINATFDVDTVFNQAMDVVISLTGAERGFIILRHPDTGELDFRVVRENELSKKSGDVGQPQISQTIVNDVLDSGEPLLTDNAYKEQQFESNLSVHALSLRSVLCVPMTYRERTVGVVYVDNRLRAGVFEEREKNLLAAFANQVSVAIENANLFRSIQDSVAEITEIKDLTDNIFESIGSGVMTVDRTDTVLSLNRAAILIIGREADDVLGRKLDDVLNSPGTEFHETLTAVRETNESQLLDAELEVEGRRIAVNIKLSPLQNARGDTYGVALVLDDVTKQKERDEELTIMKRYLPEVMVEKIHSIANLDLGGERREVTCMYVDVLPLYHLPRGMRPQEMMEMVNVYLSVATKCIHDAQGVIDKYMGQEIMVLFNSQLNPLDNHAQQAIEAALAIRDAFIQTYERLGIDPDPHFYRIGLHTGVATLGNVGSINRRDFTAIGDTINLSKRLEENASSGQIIVSEVARQHAETRANGTPLAVRFDPHEPIKAKGRQEFTTVYEVSRL